MDITESIRCAQIALHPYGLKKVQVIEQVADRQLKEFLTYNGYEKFIDLEDPDYRDMQIVAFQYVDERSSRENRYYYFEMDARLLGKFVSEMVS